MKTEPRTLNTLVKWINRHPHYNVEIMINSDCGYDFTASSSDEVVVRSYGPDLKEHLETVLESLEAHYEYCNK